MIKDVMGVAFNYVGEIALVVFAVSFVLLCLNMFFVSSRTTQSQANIVLDELPRSQDK